MEILKTNLRHFFWLPFGSACGILFVTLFIFPVSALKGAEVGKTFEMFFPFVGAAMLTPVFLPEQDDSIRDVIASKKKSCSVVYAVRLLYSVCALAALTLLLTAILYLNECEVHWFHLYGGFASAFFLGSIGFTVSGIGGNAVMGYMADVVYYLACYGMKKQLGVFWLFRMSAGIKTGKTWLIAGAFLLIGLTFGMRNLRFRSGGRRGYEKTGR